MKINPNGFREYDARWLYEKDIDLDGITNLGKGLGTQVCNHTKKTNPCRKYVIHDKKSNPANEHNRVPSKTEQERRSLLDGHSSQQHVELARMLLPQQAVRLRPGAPLDLAGQDTPTKSRPIARRPLQRSQTSTTPKSVSP